MEQNRINRLLAELVEIDSVNPSLDSRGAGEKQLARYLGEHLHGIGCEVVYQELGPDRANVIGVLRGTGGGRNLLLNGHLDTVSLGGMPEALTARISDGRLYGRGSADMKGGIAAIVTAAESIIMNGETLRGDVLLVFVADEEYASIGTETVATAFTADAAIICEPTGLDICIAHKGFAWERVTVHGVAAHGSDAATGVDAIVKAGKLLVAVEQLAEQLKSKSHPLLGTPSIHASLIKGGTELSTYPDRCEIQLERRCLPGETPELLREEMQSLLAQLTDKDGKFCAEHSLFFYRSPMEISPEETIVQMLKTACQQVLGHQVGLTGSGGWMDSAILADAGIPTVIFGPVGGGLHADDEWVDLNSVMQTAQVLKQVIRSFCV